MEFSPQTGAYVCVQALESHAPSTKTLYPAASALHALLNVCPSTHTGAIISGHMFVLHAPKLSMIIRFEAAIHRFLYVCPFIPQTGLISCSHALEPPQTPDLTISIPATVAKHALS